MAAVSKPTPTPDASDAKLAQNPAAASGLAASEAVGVEKIRDLLFGNQMQDYDRRFVTLEERLQQKLRELESEGSRSLNSLESSTKKQLESVANQIREEKDLRADADKELERALREHTQALEKRMGQLSDQLARIDRDFTDRLSHESQSLREEIRRRNEDTRATIERMFAELSNVKTDRNLLAGLFVEIAKCLNQELAPKGAGRVGKADHG
jgi:DNA anti-recombination protein RmuC